MNNITPCLWFDNNAGEAVNFYLSVFDDAEILMTSHYGEGAPMPAGTVLTIRFRLQGEEFLALNGGPYFQFNEAVSFTINCKTQEEVDYYWEKLLEGGQPQQCGWLKDKFGLSWQVVPEQVSELITDPNAAKAQRAMNALMQMVKIDIAELEKAAISSTDGS